MKIGQHVIAAVIVGAIKTAELPYVSNPAGASIPDSLADSNPEYIPEIAHLIVAQVTRNQIENLQEILQEAMCILEP